MWQNRLFDYMKLVKEIILKITIFLGICINLHQTRQFKFNDNAVCDFVLPPVFQL
jgi:hypothetical protein